MTTTHQGPPGTKQAEALAPYERVEGIHVLRLSGSDYEMGFQHGKLLKDAVARGPLPYFARYVEKLLARGLLGDRAGGASRAFGSVLSATVGRRIGAKFPRHAKDALEGLADGAGMERQAVMDAVTMPETYLWVGTWYKRLFRAPLAPRHGVPVLGCTSAIAWGDATPHGRMLHGRNFDYQGVGAWDREQAVVFHDPTEGQPYVSVAAAGVLLGGITAMNASGLSLVVHQHIACTDFDLDGLPVGIVGDLVMRHAKTIDDAKRILDGHRPNGAWTYVITSAREKKVLVYEVTAHRRATIRPESGVFGYSNIFMDRELEKTEVNFYPSYWRNNVARWHRSNAALDRSFGTLDADAIAAILGDVGDGCRLTTNISALTTVASVVFDAERALVYVATGRPPVSNRPYLAFDLGQRKARTDLPRLLGGTKIDPRALEAFDAYREAYERHFNDEDLGAARHLVARARELAPEQALYAFVAGLLALEAKDTQAAKAAFDDAIRTGHAVAQRLAGFHLWRARTLDVMGHRPDALIDYREAAFAGDPNVRKAGERGLKRAWRLRTPAVEWNFGEVIAP
jgi:tetratricopeptide (TPR) repeat protein